MFSSNKVEKMEHGFHNARLLCHVKAEMGRKNSKEHRIYTNILLLDRLVLTSLSLSEKFWPFPMTIEYIYQIYYSFCSCNGGKYQILSYAVKG